MPRVSYPSSVNLGEREKGTIATECFDIANLGSSTLVIDYFGASCSCAGIEEEIEGESKRLEALSIEPGQSRRCRLRLGVNGRAGDPQILHAWFRTNDPLEPKGSIQFVVSRVKAGLCFEPGSVFFGSVCRGEVASKVLLVYDGGVPGRAIASVRSTQPSKFEPILITDRNEI
jgi:hypothetical protein